jgi:hypothetical protein
MKFTHKSYSIIKRIALNKDEVEVYTEAENEGENEGEGEGDINDEIED